MQCQISNQSRCNMVWMICIEKGYVQWGKNNNMKLTCIANLSECNVCYCGSKAFILERSKVSWNTSECSGDLNWKTEPEIRSPPAIIIHSSALHSIVFECRSVSFGPSQTVPVQTQSSFKNVLFLHHLLKPFELH